MAQATLTVQGFSPQVFDLDVAVQYYMHREDREVFGYLRGGVPCPAVFVLKDDPHAVMDRQWQYATMGANYNMLLENVYLLFDNHLAFANNTGFSSLDNPGKRDFFYNRLGYTEDVRLDKVRTTARSVLTGTEQYSLPQTLTCAWHIVRALRARRVPIQRAAWDFRQLLTTSPNVLNVKVFDSRQLPPLKPGRSYPTDISQVNPDDYLYSPQFNPEMFLVANIVNSREEVVQFPRGALYPWFEGGQTPGSFVPHVANLGYGPVLYPLWKLNKLPLGSPAPSPYRHLA